MPLCTLGDHLGHCQAYRGVLYICMNKIAPFSSLTILHIGSTCQLSPTFFLLSSLSLSASILGIPSSAGPTPPRPQRRQRRRQSSTSSSAGASGGVPLPGGSRRPFLASSRASSQRQPARATAETRGSSCV
jgi:hypothetical protein